MIGCHYSPRDWVERPFNVTPHHWYESHHTIKTLGYLFAGVTTLVTSTILYATQGIVPKICAVSLSTLSLLGLVFIHLYKGEFQNDPSSLNEKGREIWNKLKAKKLPYNDMKNAFPKVIRDSLTRDDYNELLRYDAAELDPTLFFLKHRQEALDVLDTPNREALLCQECLQQGYQVFVKSYSKEIITYDLNPDKLATKLHQRFFIQLQRAVNWNHFFELHGELFVEKLCEKNKELKERLKANFLLVPKFSNHENYCRILGITPLELSQTLCKTGMKSSYKAFKDNYGFNILQNQELIPNDQFIQIRSHFFDSCVLDLPLTWTEEEEKCLQFNFTTILMSRWMNKKATVILKMDPQEFLNRLESPLFRLNKMIEQEIASMELEKILDHFPPLIFIKVLTNLSSNFQKAIAQFYQQNIKLFYTTTSHPILEKMIKLNVTPSSFLEKKINSTRISYKNELAKTKLQEDEVKSLDHKFEKLSLDFLSDYISSL